MSFAPEMLVRGERNFCGNALRFATRDEAEANAANKMWNWTSVIETRVVETNDPVNYRWDFETSRLICLD